LKIIFLNKECSLDIYKCSNLVELKIIKRDTNAWIES